MPIRSASSSRPSKTSGRPSPHEVVAVISQPSHAGLNPELKAFWENETWRNRLIFLCGSETFTEVSRAAADMKAAQDQVADFEAQRYADAQPETQQARAALDRHNTAFRSALRETFTQLHFPDVSSGKLEAASLKLDFSANAFCGQLAILDTLTDQKSSSPCRERLAPRRVRALHLHRANRELARPRRDGRPTRRLVFSTAGRSGDDEERCHPQGRLARRGRRLFAKGTIPERKDERRAFAAQQNETTGRVTFQVSAKHGDRVYMKRAAVRRP